MAGEGWIVRARLDCAGEAGMAGEAGECGNVCECGVWEWRVVYFNE
jgi:hypothetical protein